MIIISWDVGIIHLAYCVLEYNYVDEKKTARIDILDWDNINLVEEDRTELFCCGKTKPKKNQKSVVCDKKASYSLAQSDGTEIGFCKTHLPQHTKYSSVPEIEKMFRKKETRRGCGYIQKSGNQCGKNSKYIYKGGDGKKYYCSAHYKTELNQKIKKFSPKPIKNTAVPKYPTSQLQLALVNKLDALAEHFASLGIEEVVIENQPSQKNPKMKSIANTLFDYFMIRGYIDKAHNLDISLVRFICPSNKLKVNKDNTIEVFKSNKNDSKKYKLTKALGVQYTKQLLGKEPEQLEYLELYNKKDDMCDAYLQGRYYLEFIRHKQAPETGSKTAKKRPEVARNKKKKKSRSQPARKKINTESVISL